jgi:hypothetical protein
VKLGLSILSLATLIALPAQALEWRWSYQGEGVTAWGSLTTKDAPNADGFYAITGVKGEANGVAITGLQPAGTSIPGNDGYPVDGLVRTEAPQLSLHGFGYALADGTYANPFYGDHFVPPGVFLRSKEPQDERAAGEIHRDDCPLGRHRCAVVFRRALRTPPRPRVPLDHDGHLYERPIMTSRPLIRLRRR